MSQNRSQVGRTTTMQPRKAFGPAGQVGRTRGAFDFARFGSSSDNTAMAGSPPPLEAVAYEVVVGSVGAGYMPTPLPGSSQSGPDGSYDLTQEDVYNWSLANYQSLGMSNAQALANYNVSAYGNCISTNAQNGKYGNAGTGDSVIPFLWVPLAPIIGAKSDLQVSAIRKACQIALIAKVAADLNAYAASQGWGPSAPPMPLLTPGSGSGIAQLQAQLAAAMAALQGAQASGDLDLIAALQAQVAAAQEALDAAMQNAHSPLSAAQQAASICKGLAAIKPGPLAPLQVANLNKQLAALGYKCVNGKPVQVFSNAAPRQFGTIAIPGVTPHVGLSPMATQTNTQTWGGLTDAQFANAIGQLDCNQLQALMTSGALDNVKRARAQDMYDRKCRAAMAPYHAAGQPPSPPPPQFNVRATGRVSGAKMNKVQSRKFGQVGAVMFGPARFGGYGGGGISAIEICRQLQNGGLSVDQRQALNVTLRQMGYQCVNGQPVRFGNGNSYGYDGNGGIIGLRNRGNFGNFGTFGGIVSSGMPGAGLFGRGSPTAGSAVAGRVGAIMDSTLSSVVPFNGQNVNVDESSFAATRTPQAYSDALDALDKAANYAVTDNDNAAIDQVATSIEAANAVRTVASDPGSTATVQAAAAQGDPNAAAIGQAAQTMGLADMKSDATGIANGMNAGDSVSNQVAQSIVDTANTSGPGQQYATAMAAMIGHCCDACASQKQTVQSTVPWSPSIPRHPMIPFVPGLGGGGGPTTQIYFPQGPTGGGGGGGFGNGGRRPFGPSPTPPPPTTQIAQVYPNPVPLYPYVPPPVMVPTAPTPPVVFVPPGNPATPGLSFTPPPAINLGQMPGVTPLTPNVRAPATTPLVPLLTLVTVKKPTHIKLLPWGPVYTGANIQ